MIKNVSVQSIIAQKVEKEEALKEAQEKKKKFERVEFNENHYLDTRLGKDESMRNITIRLLPFSEENDSPFQKVHVHSVRMTNADGNKVWKKFMCPIGMGKSDKCPFCETSAAARKRMYETEDKSLRDELNSIAFMNEAKDYWLVRCIDRDHEDHGVKFWRFPDAKNGKGIWDMLYSLFLLRQQKNQNIYDLYEGRDLVITVTKQVSDKGKETLSYLIQVDDDKTPLKANEDGTPNEAIMESWVNDPMTWEDVYSIKDYDYMALVVDGKYPVWSKNLNRWIGKDEADAIEHEAKVQEVSENLTPQSKDFSSFTIDTGTTKTEQAIMTTEAQSRPIIEDDGLPF